MRYARELKVGALAIICLFLLFFGFNFLKGINIFSSTYGFNGRFVHLHGLETQAPVLIKGYKVGQVDAIKYDFSRDSAFLVTISIERDVQLPYGTQMALVSDGLLGGMAIELLLPDSACEAMYKRGDYLPTCYVPGLVESLQAELLAKVGAVVEDADSLVKQLERQLADDHLKNSLQNVDRISGDLTIVASDAKTLMHTRVPVIMARADSTLAHFQSVSAELDAANLKATIAKVDTAVEQVGQVLQAVQSPDGTMGRLLKDKSLYQHLDSTIISADSLLTDLKANPKRYVHFSLFGRKDKK